MPQIVGRYGRDIFHFHANALRVSLMFDLVADEKMPLDNDIKENTTQKTVQKIMAALRRNPAVSARELAVLSGLTPRGVKWRLEQLKAQGIIRRIGADRGGHWEVVEGGNGKIADNPVRCDE
jgi:predicted HTH transcriptional regulator